MESETNKTKTVMLNKKRKYENTIYEQINKIKTVRKEKRLKIAKAMNEANNMEAKITDKMEEEKDLYFELVKSELKDNNKELYEKINEIVLIIENLAKDSKDVEINVKNSPNNIIRYENKVFPKLVFGNEIDDNTFVEILKSLLLEIKANKTHALLIQSFFRKIKYDTLYSIFCKNKLSNIKKDLILQICVERGINRDKINLGIKDAIDIIRGINDTEFDICEFNMEFKGITLYDYDLKKNIEIEINKGTLKDLLKSKAITSAIKETLGQFKDKNINSVKDKKLFEKIDKFIDTTSFYSMDMSEKIYAFTIYNSNIYFNSKYINIVRNKNDQKYLSAISIIITTFYHEFIYFLIRTLSKDDYSDNYFKINNMNFDKSGEFFDNLILGDYKGFYSVDSNFLLNIKNYNTSFKDFCNNFKNNNYINYDKLDENTFLKKSNITDDPTYLPRGKCLYSLLRGC